MRRTRVVLVGLTCLALASSCLGHSTRPTPIAGPDPAVLIAYVGVEPPDPSGSLAVEFSAQVNNIGSQEVSPGLPYRLAVTISSSGSPPFAAQLDSVIAASIPPGSNTFVLCRLELTHANTPPGSYYVVFTLDPLRTTQDADRNDNQTITHVQLP